MAVVQLVKLPTALNIKEYIGLSTDTKPVASAGSTFYCLDTRDAYMTNGTIWYIL